MYNYNTFTAVQYNTEYVYIRCNVNDCVMYF